MRGGIVPERVVIRPQVARLTGGRTYPASFGQQRLWFLDRLLPSQSWYVIPGVYRLRGRLDVSALAGAVTKVIGRHESLRTTFRDDGEELVQVVAPAAPFTISMQNLSGLAPAARDAAVRDAIDTDMHRPFDLMAGPLLRMTVLRADRDDHYLLFCVHHIAFDGVSAAIMFDELRVAYDAYVTGKPVSLAEPTSQYADYARWQHEHAGTPAFARQLAYWKRQLAGLPRHLDLPADRPRPAERAAAGATEFTALPTDLTGRLEELGRQERGTLFMVLLTALQVVLSRYTGRSDSCVCTAVAGRTRREWQPLIGFFANTLPLRVDLSGEPAFREAVRRVRTVLIGALMNQDVPYEHVVRQAGLASRLAHAPMFQVMVTMQQSEDAQGAPLNLPGLTTESVELSYDTTDFDLTLMLAKDPDGGLGAMLRYSVDLFDADTARGLLRHFRNILCCAATDPDRSVTTMDMLQDTERREVLTKWNGTERPIPRQPVPQLFEAQAAKTPDAVAVIDRGAKLCYAELNARANRLAHHLIGLRVGPEDIVALAIPPSAEMVVAMLAVLKAGAAYLPIDTDNPPGRIAYLLDDAQPVCVITTTRAAPRLPTSDKKQLTLDTTELAGALDMHPPTDPGDSNRTRPLRMSNAAYVIYTSGSTGRPKGVVIQHDSLANYLAWTTLRYPHARGTALLHSPPTFDLTVTALYTPLVSGGCVVLAALTGEQQSTADDLAERQVTFVKATPSHLPLLTALPEQFSPTGELLLGGEPLTGQALAGWRSRHPAAIVRNVYGPTETTVNCTEYTIEPGEAVPDGAVPIGRPQGNVRAYLLNEGLQPVPIGVAGELYVSGAGLARGYLNRPGLTAERFVPDPYGPRGSRMYRTGDLARRQRDGDLVYVARADRQLKVRGVRIEPGEIEALLAEHPAVRSCAVTTRTDVPGDQRVVAYAVLTAAGAATPAVLREYLTGRLPTALVPASYVLLDQLPLTPNGKVDRAALPAPDVLEPAVDGPITEPRTPMELALADIWSAVLRTGRIGVHDDFFTVGGHSFSALWLTTLVAERLGRHLALADVFRWRTIAGQAALLGDTSDDGTRSSASVLIPLTEKRPDRQPLVLIPSLWGNPAEYRWLAEQLAADYSVYSPMAPGLEPGTCPLSRIEDIASHYVRALDAAGCTEPYLIGGFSYGGIIALEMALQLTELGRTVDTLLMFDSRARSFDGGGRLTKEEIAILTPDEDHPYHYAEPEQAVRMITVARASLGTLADYQPRAMYQGRVVVVIAEDGPDDPYGPARGWEQWVRGQLDVRSMPGLHDDMLIPSSTPRLAAEIRAGLAWPEGG
jgi:amino acid adenylation domain-containing protein